MEWAMGHAVRSFLLAAMLLTASSCAVNPVPEPPATPTLGGPVDWVDCAPCDGKTRVEAGPGATTDATTVWAVNLDGMDPPTEAAVAPDGSFTIDLFLAVGNELRLQARNGDRRSAPLDLRLESGGTLAPAPRPFADCFVLAPELDFGTVGVAQAVQQTITLSHDCPATLTVSRAGLRAPSTALSVQAPAVPFTLAPSAASELTITLDAPSAGVVEEILLIETSSPQWDRRAVTLMGNAQP
jgi:hypothetical protein